MSAAAAASRVGRPKRPVHSRFIQIQPHRTQVTLPVPAADRRYAATIKLTPQLMRALQTGAGASVSFGEKENDVCLVVGGVSYPLRCGHEEPHKSEVFESTVYEEEEDTADAASASASASSAHAQAASSTDALAAPSPSTPLPLFAPYHNVMHALPHLQLINKFYVPKQLDEEDKRKIQKLSEQSAKAAKQKQIKRTDIVALPASTSAEGFDHKTAAKERKRKSVPSAPTDAAAAAAAAEEPKQKRKYTKKASAAAAPAVVPASPEPFLTPRTPAPAAPHTAASPSAMSVMSPVAPPGASSTVAAATAAAPVAPASGSSAPHKPRLTRSPSTAAVPTASTQGEKLRARVSHFLAAQPHGLTLSTLTQRLQVGASGLNEMKAVLGAVARYEAPGFYKLREEVYKELRVDSWEDYGEQDRRRVVDKMIQMNSDVPEEWRRFASAGANNNSSSEWDASVNSVPLMPEAPLPPLPNLDDLLLDALPTHLLGTDPANSVSSSSSSPSPVLAPSLSIEHYMDYLQLHTQFLEQFRAYKQMDAWMQTVESTISHIRSDAAASTSSHVRQARERQAAAFEQRHESTLSSCRLKHAALHLHLATLKPALIAYAEKHQLFTTPLLDGRVA